MIFFPHLLNVFVLVILNMIWEKKSSCSCPFAQSALISDLVSQFLVVIMYFIMR